MGTLEHMHRRLLKPDANDRFHIVRNYTPFTEGVAYNAALGSAVARQTEQITVNVPVIITSIQFNLPSASTYTVKLVFSGTSTSVYQILVASLVAGAAGLTTFTPDAGEFLLVPNTNYFFQLTALANQKWRYNNVAATYSGTYVNMLGLWHTTSSYSYVAAMYLIGYPVGLRSTIPMILGGYVIPQGG